MNELYRETYAKLPERERQALLVSLAERHPGLELKRFARFDRFGRGTDTAIYSLDGSEFVFVPGDTVKLGWDSFADGFDEATKQDVDETLGEFDIEDGEAWIGSLMSPVRTVTVPPMLAERKLREVGWTKAPPGDAATAERWKAQIDIFENSSTSRLTIDKRLRLDRSEGATVLSTYAPVSYAEWLQSLQTQGFSAPTEDEWEYLCGGGSRTLWRFGDSFDYDMHLKHFQAPERKGEPYDLELPNEFGLHIAYDPYQYEVVDGACFLKGGDGGSLICGGTGMAIGYLPTATYYRQSYMGEAAEADYKADIGGDYTFYRRIVRIRD
ncbi:Sulfatase-modifying factor enzyme 1 [Cohnella sp. OV330]|uniref:SUMF1/EgtB/PvdO family nonheme iron enzyme n=1 Tax=Cohnella sp. OV330 TaxID=1855288 RepID=UPI0008E199D7|nr:SUMF1/EgtB/PvdO family nonheme iron enzyme [Cohnella sp. OV330]SFB52079.1 Sulfatase-modifying factor enzyme 1 [Cohnella sp. OV330]